jgi:DNA-directed RNA polymerase specialized sigma subunit
MLSREEESNLIRAAQAGDPDAANQLVEAYKPYLRTMVVDQYPAGDNGAVNGRTRELRDDYEAELLAALWEAVHRFDPETDTRLAGALERIRGEARDAVEARRFSLSVPLITAKRFRRAHRIAEALQAGDPCEKCGEYVADAFAAITHALRHCKLSLATYTDLLGLLDSPTYEDADAGRKDRWGHTVSAYVPDDPEDQAELAEVALESMTDLQHYLAVHKYGFERDPETGDYVPMPTEYVNTGRPDAEVADWYNEQPIERKPRTRSGGHLLARRTVTDEIQAGLATARQAIEAYREGER